MSKVLVSETNLVAIGNAIREKNGETTKYKPGEMAAAISAITTGDGGSGGDIEIPVITGDCQYRFASNGWNWTIENFGNQMRTENITNCNYMFSNSSGLEEIPFEINCKSNTDISMANMFQYCSRLTEIPKINNARPISIDSLFKTCAYLKHLPEDMESWFDWSKYDNATSAYSNYLMSSMCYNCNSLRNFPTGMLAHENKLATSTYGLPYYNTFVNCYNLDRIVDIPVSEKWTTLAMTSNLFTDTFTSTNRVEDITFRLYDGAPRVVKWKSQFINLSSNIGYSNYVSNQLNYGIGEDKRVVDDEIYAALKNDPDWWCFGPDYSRYNHDSAVRTINTLPDASAYLAEVGGSNTIRFKGAAGAKTDGGAINTLTEEEIAVATAKGWTVSLV